MTDKKPIEFSLVKRGVLMGHSDWVTSIISGFS
jgi:hypothetical protein